MKPETRQSLITTIYKNTVLRLPAEVSHALAERVLRIGPVQNLLRQEFSPPSQDRLTITINGHKIPIFAIAAGLDKKGSMAGLSNFVSGIEYGGFTIFPRAGNPRIEKVKTGDKTRLAGRIIRDRKTGIALNHMGFPNPGIEKASQNILSARPNHLDLLFGINIPPTPGEKDPEKVKDYLTHVTEISLSLGPSWITFNPSCPNNHDSARYRKVSSITSLMKHMSQFITNDSPPFFVKIGPDMVDQDIKSIVVAAKNLGFAGIIAVNTTADYTEERKPYAGYPGGLSGALLKEKMLRTVRLVRRFDKELGGPQLFICACGGISNWQDWDEARLLGADFAQILTGFIYDPYIFKRLSQQELSRIR